MSNITSLMNMLIQEGAPIIASYLGTPLAGAVVAAIAHHYGMPNDASVNDVYTTVQAAPLHLKSLEFDHREHLAKLFADIVADESGIKSWMAPILSLLAFIGLCAYIYLDYLKP